MTLHVLIVDDDPALCRSLERVTTLHFAPVAHVAHDVRSALERIEAIPRDARAVVLSDLDLRDPDGDGVDVLLAARLRLPEAKRLLMSGHPPEVLEHAARRAEAHAALSKPFAPSALLDAIERALDGS